MKTPYTCFKKKKSEPESTRKNSHHSQKTQAERIQEKKLTGHIFYTRSPHQRRNGVINRSYRQSTTQFDFTYFTARSAAQAAWSRACPPVSMPPHLCRRGHHGPPSRSRLQGHPRAPVCPCCPLSCIPSFPLLVLPSRAPAFLSCCLPACLPVPDRLLVALALALLCCTPLRRSVAASFPLPRFVPLSVCPSLGFGGVFF